MKLSEARDKRVVAENKDFLKDVTNDISDIASQLKTLQQLLYMANLSLSNGVRYEKLLEAMAFIDDTLLDVSIHINQVADEMNVYIQNPPVI